GSSKHLFFTRTHCRALGGGKRAGSSGTELRMWWCSDWNERAVQSKVGFYGTLMRGLVAKPAPLRPTSCRCGKSWRPTARSCSTSREKGDAIGLAGRVIAQRERGCCCSVQGLDASWQCRRPENSW